MKQVIRACGYFQRRQVVRILSQVCLLLCLSGVTWAQQQPTSPTVEAIELQLGQSISLPFHDRSLFSFQLTLQAGDFLLFEVNNHDSAQKSGWGANIYRPDQEKTFCDLWDTTRDKQRGWGKLVAEQSGVHQLAIHWGGESAPDARFTLTIREWHRATETEVLLLQTVRQGRKLIDSYNLQTAEVLRSLIEQAGNPAALLEELGDFNHAGLLRYYTGLAHHDLGEYRAALLLFQHARGLYQRANNKLEEAVAVMSLGETFQKQSRFQEALDAYAQAIPLWEQCHPDLIGGRKGWTLADIGTVYASMGESELAMTYYQQALKEYEQLNSVARDRNRGIGTINAKIGQLQASTGNWSSALKHYQQAVAYMKEREGPTFWGRFHARLGESYAAIGELKAAEATLLEGLQIWQEAGDPYMQAGVLTSLGKFYLQQKDYATALHYLEQALTLQQSLQDRRGQAETLYQLSQVERARQATASAAAYIKQAVAMIEEVRTGLTDTELRTSFLATVQDYYALQLDLLMQLHQQAPQAGHQLAAWQVSERAKARSLLDTLHEARTDIRSGVAPALLASERELQQTIQEKSAWLTELLRQREGAQQVEEVRNELQLLRAEYEQALARVRAVSPRYTALTHPQPISLPELQGELGTDTVLLEFALGERQSYLWVISQQSFQSYALPGRAQVEAPARRAYEALTAHTRRLANETLMQRETRLAEADREFALEADKLSAMLLGPIQIPRDAKRLLVVADGTLHYLPFAALPVPAPFHTGIAPPSTTPHPVEPQRPRLLLEQYEIVQLPSATTLSALRQSEKQRSPVTQEIAIFADPVFDEWDSRVKSHTAASVTSLPKASLSPKLTQALRSAGIAETGGTIPRLLFTRREAEAISRLVPAARQLKALGFDANRQQANGQALRQYRRLHFATHGLVDSKNPALSGILLSLVDEQGRPQDGMLRLQDIYNLHLNAELVVISACQTAIGKEVRGEGLLSLSRGFLYAGSQRVISTLWKVDDRATAELMSQFYQELLSPKSSNTAAALRLAQRKLLENPRWQSPRFWAAFIQQGDW